MKEDVRVVRMASPTDGVEVADRASERRKHLADIVHRQLFLEACVARPVSKAELLANPKAQQAVKKEWDRLRAINCWDESVVYEWSDLAKWCRETNTDNNLYGVWW